MAEGRREKRHLLPCLFLGMASCHVLMVSPMLFQWEAGWLCIWGLVTWGSAGCPANGRACVQMDVQTCRPFPQHGFGLAGSRTVLLCCADESNGVGLTMT